MSPKHKVLKVAAGLYKVTSYSTVNEATFETKYKLHKLEDSPSTSLSMTRDEGLKFYKEMTTIRIMETEAAKLYKSRLIRGFCHLYSGQEACCVGMEAGITHDDAVITGYRANGWAYMHGISVKKVLTELTGRVSGCARGKGGSMHMYAPNFYGGNGIVGAQVPLGAGIAFALKYEGKPNVCLTVYGDGAANQGQLFEAFNIAKLWDLPVIFVCENNKYGMGTSITRASASTDFYSRGDYIPGILVDGMDVLATKEATRFSKEYVLNNGPIVIEALTYSYYGHSMSDKRTRDRNCEEIEREKATIDPIMTHKNRLIDSGLATAEELKQIDTCIRKMVGKASKKVKSNDEPPLEELYNYIIKDPPADMLVRGCDSTIWAKTKA